KKMQNDAARSRDHSNLYPLTSLARRLLAKAFGVASLKATDSEYLSRQRQKFFAHDLAVLRRVNADLGQLHSLFRILVRYVNIVLHHEAIVGHEGSANFSTVHLHVL